MKNHPLRIGLFAIILLGIVSCKSKERQLADKKISELEKFVDSLKMVSNEDRAANWDVISTNYDTKTTDANQSLTNLDETSKTLSQQKIDASVAKYKDLKITPEKSKPEPIKEAISKKTTSNQLLRDRYFGAGKIGEDMNFGWVNKNNILKTYDTFFQFYKNNKKNFSREDYDETKLIYEALDSRKNTVEKEGLTSTDNAKIASIKFKFAPMFKINRIGAKSRENEEAKE